MRLGVAVLVLAALWGFNSFRESADERRLGQVAGAIAGRDVSVRCQGFFAELVDIQPRGGSVQFDAKGRPSRSTFLTRRRCRALSRLLDAESQRVADAALGVETLAHEAYHLRGIQNEAVTQCYALQTMTFVARRLGATPGQASAFARYSWGRYGAVDPEYRSDDCRDGGRLDLRPATNDWP